MPRRSSARKMMAQMIRRISNSRSGCSANTGDSGSLQANNKCESQQVVSMSTYARGAGAGGGGWMTGGGYLQMTVITSSPSISRPGWNRTTMSLEKTLVFVCNIQQILS